MRVSEAELYVLEYTYTVPWHSQLNRHNKAKPSTHPHSIILLLRIVYPPVRPVALTAHQLAHDLLPTPEPRRGAHDRDNGEEDEVVEQAPALLDLGNGDRGLSGGDRGVGRGLHARRLRELVRGQLGGRGVRGFCGLSGGLG